MFKNKFLFLLFLTCSISLILLPREACASKSGSRKSTMMQLSSASTIDIEELGKKLSGDGLQCEIHAADRANRQYVATYRDPKNFFNNVQLVIVSHDKAVLSFFQSMKRHDIVLIKGEFFHQGEFMPESPQPHVEVSSISMKEEYKPSIVASEKFQKSNKLPQELQGKSEADFLVHSVLKQGAFLVLEYGDNFVFVVVPDKKFTENLYRNDRIHMRFRIQSFPSMPTHIELDTDTSGGKKPLEVTDSIHALHAKKYTQEGFLVRFPKSPQIVRDIWAVEQKGPNGNSRTFTLVNFTVKGEQEKIDAKLKAWWDAAADGVVDGRNKLVNSKVKIKATGIMNVVDPNQANAQMQLKARDLSLLKQ